MSNRDHRRDDDGDFVEAVTSTNAEEIPWAHPALEPLSEAARFIYACLVDRRSETARATLRGVDVVWRNRDGDRGRQLLGREAFEEICFAVQELLESGLLILRDANSVQTGWIRRPWEAVS